MTQKPEAKPYFGDQTPRRTAVQMDWLARGGNESARKSMKREVASIAGLA